MTEREKAQQGLLYNSDLDPALAGARARCKALCHEHNQLPPGQVERRQALLRQILGRAPQSFFIEQPFYCDYGENIELGEHFYANYNCVILDAARVTFGRNVFVAPNCGFYTAGHPLDAGRRNQWLEYALPICVGDDVWIGAGVQVMPGVTIASNTVIGAGSVVTRDVPSGVVAAGNPCRVLRSITQEDAQRISFGRR